MNPAPETPLNVPIGPHRRFVGVRNELKHFKTIKNAFGGTVNDVVLTVVSGSLREWLQSRGVRTEGLELRALVPVSIAPRPSAASSATASPSCAGRCRSTWRTRSRGLQAGAPLDGRAQGVQAAVGAEVLTGVQNFAPPTILAQASRLNFSTRFFNLIVTNVPGPQFPLYVRGRELEDVFPVAFLPENHALRSRSCLQRQDQLRPARRLRRAAGHRPRSPTASRRRWRSSSRWPAARCRSPQPEARVGAPRRVLAVARPCRPAIE
jgi:hypothetical protein